MLVVNMLSDTAATAGELAGVNKDREAVKSRRSFKAEVVFDELGDIACSMSGVCELTLFDEV